MATVPITSLGNGTVFAAADQLVFVDVSDTSQAPTGTTLHATLTNFFAGIPVPIAQATGTVVVSTPVYQATQTWNDAAVTFTALDLNITDTASAAGSLLRNYRVGGVSKWKVTKAGASTQTGSLTAVGVDYGSGTLVGSGDVAINTDKFTITAASGNFASKGTGQVATTLGVGAATPAASGAGVTFPATQSASTDVNTLDDYEEGDCTLTVGGSSTYTTQICRFVKIGKKVTVWANVRINAIGTGSATTLSGLPFAAASNGIIYTVPLSFWSALQTLQAFVVGEIAAGASAITFNGQDAVNGVSITNTTISLFGNGAWVRFIATYEAAA